MTDQYSPIFLQFIDCVFQIMHQYPTAFEFNERFLISVLDHVFSNVFGTFLFNSMREREQHEVSLRTESLWTWVLARRILFCNPSYKPGETEGGSTPASLNVNPQTAVFWVSFFMRHHQRFHALAGTNDPSLLTAPASIDARIEALEEENRLLKVDKAHLVDLELEVQQLSLENAVLRHRESELAARVQQLEAELSKAQLQLPPPSVPEPHERSFVRRPESLGSIDSRSSAIDSPIKRLRANGEVFL
jgi:hypothetical protein